MCVSAWSENMCTNFHIQVHLCVCTVMVCMCVCVCMHVYVRPSSCCLCNSSKHQGSALLCWINESLTSIATRRLWNTHRQPRLGTLNSQSFSPSPTLLLSVSNYTPVKYLLISTLVVFSPFDLFLILHPWIHFHSSGWNWRCDHNCCGATRGAEHLYFWFLQTENTLHLKYQLLHYSHKTHWFFITDCSSMSPGVLLFSCLYSQVLIRYCQLLKDLLTIKQQISTWYKVFDRLTI